MIDPIGEIEKEIIDICKPILIQLKGNQAGDGYALIDVERIKTLNNQLEKYQAVIQDEEQVNKNVVGVLFYTCSRFYIQSKYSKNSKELIEQFEQLNTRLIEMYLINR
ncbi:hypothetical protein DNH61_03570 [Paenibacillus sambharensis]|uniref:Uncharacterized protein n=1 Tax=Paenibacillus sambharensis TaxID=1803190 RepID=A0A2W1M0I3_9BACL|nr:hypothetical protein [Paenibacillus sambharensis]PZD97227.1 hypothetical protein DNH61_03570 [Paenibacillus sambharensis]